MGRSKRTDFHLEKGHARRSQMPAYNPDPQLLDLFMHGQCAAWAVAHANTHPHLQLGIHWEKMSDEDSAREAEEDGEDWDGSPLYQAQHVFTHDDKFAYDVSGKHALPYLDWDSTDTGLTEEDIEDTGMLEYGYMGVAEEMFAAGIDPMHLSKSFVVIPPTKGLGTEQVPQGARTQKPA